MIVVSDSSPLIALVDIGQLRLLQELFSTVLIPEAVYQEIVVQGAGRASAEVVKGAAWIEQRRVVNTELAAVLKLELDAGEAEAIALAVESGADLVLLDERRGRQRAAGMGLRVTGVLGVLVQAKQRHLLTAVRPVLDALRNEAGFWISDDLYRRVLDLTGETSQGAQIGTQVILTPDAMAAAMVKAFEGGASAINNPITDILPKIFQQPAISCKTGEVEENAKSPHKRRKQRF